MIQIIPAIIAKDFQELKNKIKRIEPFVEWAQLDVMDGKFVENITWPYAEPGKNNLLDLRELKTDLKLEAHLMIENPEEVVDDWIKSGVKRIIIHHESTEKHKEIIERIKDAGLEVGLAINPETSVEVIDEFIKDVNLILIMTVNPGRGGQKFLEETLGKIRALRDKYKNVRIGVDGGINLETALSVVQAGANILSVGNAIFKSEDIKKTIEELKLT